jgi:1-acylglycerone phosphate reductase
VLGISPVVDLDLDRVKEAFDANTFSVIRVAKAVVPHMAKVKSGLIINIGSVVGNIASPWNGLYAASKPALHSISDNLDMELRPFNIKVLLVAPGGVKSNISKNQASSFRLASDSLYVPYLDNIIARMYSSQGPSSWETDRFAKRVVKEALKKNPPSYLSVGAYSTLYKFLLWLPRSAALYILWRSMSKKIVK